MIDRLLQMESTKATDAAKLSGQTFVVTGTLEGFSRAEAKKDEYGLVRMKAKGMGEWEIR